MATLREDQPCAWHGNWYDYEAEDRSEPGPEPTPTPNPQPEPAPAQPHKGVVVGRFLPPHAGHQYLVQFAHHYVEQLTLVVQASEEDPIPAAQRLHWLEELFSLQPQLYVGDPAGLPEWVRQNLGPPDYLFGSEPQGQEAARAMGAEYVLVDPQRQAVPISGSDIRRRPFSSWRYLPPCVRPWFVRRVVLVGPEGSGKTTLAQRLAEHFRTVWVPEQAALLAERRGGRLSQSDLLRSARAQWACEQSLARQAERVLVLDTDPLTAKLWSLRLYAACSDELSELAARGSYDLYLLLDPSDSAPDDQVAFHQRILDTLESEQRTTCRLSGNLEQRYARACEAVETLLVEPRLPATQAPSPPPAAEL